METEMKPMTKEMIQKMANKFAEVLYLGYKNGQVEEGITWKHSMHSAGVWASPLVIDILEKTFEDVPEIGPHVLKYCCATWGKGQQNGIPAIEQFSQYHYIMDMNNGFFVEWGETLDDDPEMAPANNILDIEVTTQCSGPGNYLHDQYGSKTVTESGVCPFCYKANLPVGKNMSLDTFKKVIDKMPLTLTQIAIGADAHLDQNPDLWDMMDYANSKGIAVNITCANIDDETAKLLSQKCKAVAVSRYKDKNWCYDSVKRLTDYGMHQINIHQMISQETFDIAKETINDVKTDPRLAKLNAVVFLSLKTKGRGEKFHPLSQEQFKELIDLCREKGINYGLDSCSAPKLMKALKGDPDYEKVFEAVMSCESTLESAYVNVDGEYFPCSFTEGEEGWEQGIPVVKTKDFIENVWNNKRTKEFRKKLCASTDENRCRNCPLFNI